MATMPSDPAKHFGLSSCSMCVAKPCMQILCGAVKEGEYVLAVTRHVVYAWCPLTAESMDEVAWYLRLLSISKISSILSGVYSQLSFSDTQHYNLRHFGVNSTNPAATVNLLLQMLRENAVCAIGIPFRCNHDQRILAWLHASKKAGVLPGEAVQQLEQDSGPAQTDEVAEQTPAQITVNNPRWEHKDETLRQNNPDKSSVGDTIKLLVDIQGYVEGGKVTFDIYDISKDTPQRLDTVYGKNAAGAAFAEWKVEDPRKETDTYELKLAFEGSARSKYSERKEIGFAQKISVRLSIDPNKVESKNDTFRLFSTDSAKSYEQVKTIKDDTIPGDNCVDLTFTGLDEKLSYSLEIDPGPEGKKYYFFENCSFGKWGD